MLLESQVGLVLSVLTKYLKSDSPVPVATMVLLFWVKVIVGMVKSICFLANPQTWLEFLAVKQAQRSSAIAVVVDPSVQPDVTLELQVGLVLSVLTKYLKSESPVPVATMVLLFWVKVIVGIDRSICFLANPQTWLEFLAVKQAQRSSAIADVVDPSVQPVVLVESQVGLVLSVLTKYLKSDSPVPVATMVLLFWVKVIVGMVKSICFLANPQTWLEFLALKQAQRSSAIADVVDPSVQPVVLVESQVGLVLSVLTKYLKSDSPVPEAVIVLLFWVKVIVGIDRSICFLANPQTWLEFLAVKQAQRSSAIADVVDPSVQPDVTLELQVGLVLSVLTKYLKSESPVPVATMVLLFWVKVIVGMVKSICFLANPQTWLEFLAVKQAQRSSTIAVVVDPSV